MKKRLIALAIVMCLLVPCTADAAWEGGAWDSINNALRNIKSNMLPNRDNAFDLGSATKRFASLYVVNLTFTAGNILMSDEAWIGLGAAAGRLVFNDEATDNLNFEDCDLIFNDSSTGSRNVRFESNSNQNMFYLDGNGNIVAIGTNDTSGGAELTVNGAQAIGTPTLDCGTFTMIKGAQAGDPQAQFALSSDANGDLGITTDTGDITLTTPANLYLTPTGSIDWTTGNVIYVPLAGSIEAYHDAATAGDTLILSSGNYVVTDDIDITKAINIVGQGVGKTTISCATASKNVFDISVSNVRIADLSISSTGATNIGINTANNLSGLRFENLDVAINSSGAVYGGYILGSSAVLKNVSIDVRSSDAVARAIFYSNNSSTTGSSELSAFNIKLYSDATTNSGAALYVDNNNVAQTIKAYLYDSSFEVADAGTFDTGLFVGSTTTNNAFAYAYGCTFNGQDYDVRQTGTNTLTLYDCTLVNGTTSGTITYAGTVVGGALGVGGANTSGNIATFTQNSDTISLLHDGTDAYMKWSDGNLILRTDEGTNTTTTVEIKGKGTGNGQLNIYGDAANETVNYLMSGLQHRIDFGSAVTDFIINELGADTNVRVESDTIANAFTIDGGTGAVGIGALNGASLNTISISELVTIPIGSGLDPVVTTVGNLAPAGSIITGAAFRVTQAPGGGATTLDIGITGGDLDLLIDGASCDVLGETGNSHTNGAAEWTGIIRNIAATTLTLTTDADVTDTDMIVRVTVWYQTITAPTS